MNRRNFLIGVGTAATLSGAASVTGAALSNTVGAAFGGYQVIATEELTVRRNETLVEQDVLRSNKNFSNESIDFTQIGSNSPVDYTDFPKLFVNDKSDDGLVIELATSGDETAPYNTNLSSGGSEPYNGTQSYGYAPIVIENTGAKQKDIALEYDYGSSVGGGGSLSKGQVAELYSFHIDTTQISPLSSSPDSEGNTVSIDSGQTKPVNLNLHLTEATARDIQSVVGTPGQYDFSQASRERADILDTATFGTVT